MSWLLKIGLFVSLVCGSGVLLSNNILQEENKEGGQQDHRSGGHLAGTAVSPARTGTGESRSQDLSSVERLNAQALRYQGKAQQVLLCALHIREKKLGPDHPETGTSLSNWGYLLSCLGRYAEAEALQRRALLIRQKALGPSHHDVAFTMNRLAQLYQ
jgi:hypothetical protein